MPYEPEPSRNSTLMFSVGVRERREDFGVVMAVMSPHTVWSPSPWSTPGRHKGGRPMAPGAAIWRALHDT